MGANIEVVASWLRMKAREFSREEVGGGEIIATVVVIAVVIVLGIAFQDKIVGFFNDLWGQATGNSGVIGSGGSGGSGSGGSGSGGAGN